MKEILWRWWSSDCLAPPVGFEQGQNLTLATHWLTFFFVRCSDLVLLGPSRLVIRKPLRVAVWRTDGYCFRSFTSDTLIDVTPCNKENGCKNDVTLLHGSCLLSNGPGQTHEATAQGRFPNVKRWPTHNWRWRGRWKAGTWIKTKISTE